MDLLVDAQLGRHRFICVGCMLGNPVSLSLCYMHTLEIFILQIALKGIFSLQSLPNACVS